MLADDHTVIRRGLRALLEDEEDLQVIGEASTGQEAVDLACELRPAVALLDIGMPRLNGIEATKKICKRAPGVKVLILSMHFDGSSIVRSLESGASGYIFKDSPTEELIAAISTLDSNEVYLAPVARKVVMEEFLASREAVRGSIGVTLTSRERDVP